MFFKRPKNRRTHVTRELPETQNADEVTAARPVAPDDTTCLDEFFSYLGSKPDNSKLPELSAGEVPRSISSRLSRQQILHHATMDIGQSSLETVVVEG